MWPGVTSLPDYKSTFPNWPRQRLQTAMKGVDPEGINLLEVSSKFEVFGSTQIIVVVVVVVFKANARIRTLSENISTELFETPVLC